MLNDEPAVIDGLKREALVRSVGNRIHACRPPQVFGISGDWGSGKTSFLRQLQCYVSGRCGVRPNWKPRAGESHTGAEQAVVVWFEAWRYQKEDRPVVALLHEIRQQLSALHKGLREASKLGEATVRGILSIFDEVTKQIGITGLSKLQEVGEKIEGERMDKRLSTAELRDHLQKAINLLLSDGKTETPGRRLVVLIDDLDRCQPATAKKLLEDLKIFFNLDNCVFVLGMDFDLVESFIAEDYKDQKGDGRPRAHEYMEKICQNIWHLPMPTYSADFLKTSLDKIAEQQFLSSTAPARKDFFESVVKVIREENYVAPNPRRVKGFANLLERMFEHHPVRYTGEDVEDNARIAIIFGFLYLSDRPVYRILQTQPGFYNEILLRWARNPGDSNLEHYPILGMLKPVERSGPVDEATARFEVPSRIPAYPDPAQEGVMRVQRLIVKLGELKAEEVGRYLLQ